MANQCVVVLGGKVLCNSSWWKTSVWQFLMAN